MDVATGAGVVATATGASAGAEVSGVVEGSSGDGTAPGAPEGPPQAPTDSSRHSTDVTKQHLTIACLISTGACVPSSKILSIAACLGRSRFRLAGYPLSFDTGTRRLAAAQRRGRLHPRIMSSNRLSSILVCVFDFFQRCFTETTRCELDVACVGLHRFCLVAVSAGVKRLC